MLLLWGSQSNHYFNKAENLNNTKWETQSGLLIIVYKWIIYARNVVCTSTHIKTCVSSVLRHGQAFSPIYRFSLSDGTIVSAHTKSKLVRSPATSEPQLYMSLHILQRYVSLPTPVSEKERQNYSMNWVTCFSLLLPCSTTCCVDGLICKFMLASGLGLRE